MKNTESVEDAKNLLQMTGGIIKEVFQKKIMDYQTKVSEEKLDTLQINTVLKQTNETERERAIIEIFKDETIATADSLIEGMRREIEGRIIMENRTRKLDTVESDFVDKVNDKNNKLDEQESN